MITEFKNYGFLKITILKLKYYDKIHKMKNLKFLFFIHKSLLLHRRPPYRRPDSSGGRKVRTPQRSIAGNTRRS